MTQKTYVTEGEQPVVSQIGTTLETLACVIATRRDTSEKSYTYRLLTAPIDDVLKKVVEEAAEVVLAAKDVQAAADGAIDHLRYEAADVVYHLLVVFERCGIDLDEFAAELNSRMTEEERPCGGVRLYDEYIVRGK